MKLLDKFFSLPKKKQNTIIDAALSVFAANGYKKASIHDIAAAAGISKAMVFHYFGTKKELYLYLIQTSSDILMEAINENFDAGVTDFFDRIMLAASIKISVLKKHPSILLFLESTFLENDLEVKEDIRLAFSGKKVEHFRNQIVFSGMDASKFKDGVDPKLVMQMLICLAYGFTSRWNSKADIDYDALMKEFGSYIHLLKDNLYKEDTQPGQPV